MFRIVSLGILSIVTVHCHESESDEANKIEMTPFFDTIILNDVVDIFHEIENGMNPLEVLFNSAGSDNEEKLEDLLNEYQLHLDRAQKQRMDYLDKTKTKNKVPLTRHDRFTKMKLPGGMTYDDYYYTGSYVNPNKFPQTQYTGPLDVYIPVNEKLRYVGKSDFSPPIPKEEYLPSEKKILDLPPVVSNPRYEPTKSSCFCKSPQLPCDCKCKQCLFPYDSMSQSYRHPKFLSGDSETGLLSNTEFISEDKPIEDTLNIRIKVDIQLPKIKDIFNQLPKNRSRDEMNSMETTVNVPFPYLNFPIPMDLIGYKNPPRPISHDTLHKISLHKKKKSRTINGNKKHRKKVITFHNLNMQPSQPKIQPFFDEMLNSTIDYSEKMVTERYNLATKVSSENVPTMTTIRAKSFNTNNTTTANITTDTITANNETQTEESIYVMVNISNNSDNVTEEVHKTENSVETDFTKIDIKVPTEKILMSRRRRDVSPQSHPLSSSTVPNKVSEKPMDLVKKNIAPSKISSLQTKNNNDSKKSDKALLADSELVYWPDITKNLTTYASKNITTIILEREDKKTKLNMTKEAIRNNRTSALEKAIFGDVNWDDVDTVAPVFMSFVGKYLRGVLTFCSQNVCHSMRCAQKTCVHRKCQPSDRWNQRGHCAGSNRTDSIASLESIMDLPSNIAFEIVDILKDKMLGKLFGKVTLCINSKCITFVSVKKTFLKSKCSGKDLNMGHCPNIKNFKIM